MCTEKIDLLNVFYFCSDEYIGVAATSILSLLENNKSFNEIHIYIADDGITAENKEKLEQFVAPFNCVINFLGLADPSELLGFDFKDRYQIGHSYPRMCLSKLLPESITRVLCLDSDTLVLDDLGSLWNIDLEGNVIAGVSDCVNLKAYRKQFMLDDDSTYCNAGVFLVDLKKWRELHIEEKISRVINNHLGNVFFFEQTLINYCCQGNVLKLNPRYNVYTLFYTFEYENLIIWRRPSRFYSKQEIKGAIANPCIVHFTRCFYTDSHPWKEGCSHPLARCYREYMKLTPWSVLAPRGLSKRKMIMRYVLMIVPEKQVCRAAGFAYNVIRPQLWWRNE